MTGGKKIHHLQHASPVLQGNIPPHNRIRRSDSGKIPETACRIFKDVFIATVIIADRVAVLNAGDLIAEGTPDVVARDQKVIDAYLGKSFHD